MSKITVVLLALVAVALALLLFDVGAPATAAHSPSAIWDGKQGNAEY